MTLHNDAAEGPAPEPLKALLRVPEGGFLWHVPDAGHEVWSADSDRIFACLWDGPSLLRADEGQPRRYRWYDPIREAALHRTFAQLPPSPNHILRFANRYGFLGHGPERRMDEAKHPADGHGRLAGASEPDKESLSLWQREILRLSLLIDMWDMAKGGKAGTLGQWIRWHDRPRSVSVPWFGLRLPLDEPPRRRVRLLTRRVGRLGAARLALSTAEVVDGAPFEFEMSGLEEEQRLPPRVRHRLPYYEVRRYTVAGDGRDEQADAFLVEWAFGDPMEPARYYVRKEINRALARHVSPSVPIIGGGPLTYQPDCLLSAIYMHFALEVAEQKHSTVMCHNPRCGRYFPPKRSNQLYCTRKCQWRHSGNEKRRRAKSDGE